MNPLYIDVTSLADLKMLIADIAQVSKGKIVEITDQDRLQNQLIFTLQYNASVNENEKIKQACIDAINQFAELLELQSWSNTDYYDQKATGTEQFFSVPAINTRMMPFHLARGIVKAAQKKKLPHVIFELALSELGYTGQTQAEQIVLIKAAYISLGLKKTKIYVQADHYQFDPKKYTEDPEQELARLKMACTGAMEQQIFNIDIDASRLETDDPEKTDRQNQQKNAELTAEMIAFIRQYEKEHALPCEISIGGEVGEVGGSNTKYPQVNAFLAMIKEHLDQKGLGDIRGLSKISINVGSQHGGILDDQGNPVHMVDLDFQAHHDLYMKGIDPLAEGKHVLSVQHGASTLPKESFDVFPAVHVAEIHLATGFQNVIWNVLEHYDPVLFEKMRQKTFTHFPDNVAKYKNEIIGFMKERKRVTQFFKKELLHSSALDQIELAVQEESLTLFDSLYSMFHRQKENIAIGDRTD